MQSLGIRKIWRAGTSPLRVLPDFLVIGGQKCGTTFLFSLLKCHPAVRMPLQKEIHFFDYPGHFAKGLAWYRSHFPLRFSSFWHRGHHGQGFITGEASPYYLYHPHAPKRIFETLPNMKFVVLLRNPIDRAYSHYFHEVRHGFEKLSFEEAVDGEEARLSHDRERLFRDEAYYSFSHHHYSYLARGIYVDQLKTWFRFFPRANFFIAQSEKFFSDPKRVGAQVFQFLGLSTEGLWPLVGARRSGIDRNGGGRYPEMNPSIRQRLRDYFKPHNERLTALLGIDFSWGESFTSSVFSKTKIHS
ncbi:MAG: sulfotransferase domain-containing protein [Candidatus Omnitrophica bacterium]|nr:sulfotransferase domain-containing protein [Candidatus Omnitrophota bacterium]